MAARTFGRRLIHHLVPAALNAALVGVAMLDHHVGVGVVLGFGVSAVVAAVRDHRHQSKIAAESARLDAELSSALAAFRSRRDRREAEQPEDRYS